jgi:hypothetical protein
MRAASSITRRKYDGGVARRGASMSGGVRSMLLARGRRGRAALIAFPLGRRALIRDGRTKHRDGEADVSLPARCREVQLARQM